MEGRLLVGGLLVAVGFIAIYYGRKRYRVYRLVTGTPTTEAGRISESGLVELEGEVVPGEEGTIGSPVRNADCVLAGWLAEEYDESGKSSSWKTIAAGIESVPFCLDDGTGEVVVDLGSHATGSNTVAKMSDYVASEGVGMEDVVCEFDAFTNSLTVDVDAGPPDHLREFVARSRALDPAQGPAFDLDLDLDIFGGPDHGDRRFSESFVAPGDEVYLLGYATPADDDEFGGPKWTVGRPPEDDDDALAIISTVRQDRLAERARTGALALPIGVLLLAAGVAVWIQPYTPYF